MRIMIVDDHILFREGLAGLLRSQEDMEVVANAEPCRKPSLLRGRSSPR